MSSSKRHTDQGEARYLNLVPDTIASINNDTAGVITVAGTNSAGLLIIPEIDTDPNKEGEAVSINGYSPAATGYSKFGDRDNVIQHGNNLGRIIVTGNNSYGLVALPDVNHDTDAEGDYNFGLSNTNSTGLWNGVNGVVEVNATNSAAFALLEDAVAGNAGTINIGVTGTANASAGMYNERVARITGVGTQTDANMMAGSLSYRHYSFMSSNGTINIGANSTNSAGLWVKNGGMADNHGTINVNGSNNYGAIAESSPTDNKPDASYTTTVNHFYDNLGRDGASFSADNGIFVNASNAVGAFAKGKSPNGGYAQFAPRGNGVFVGLTRNYTGNPGHPSTRIIDWNGDNGSVARLADVVTPTNNVTNSIAVRLDNGLLTVGDSSQWNSEQDYGRIMTDGAGNHAVVAENDSYVDTRGLINNRSEGTIGIYLNKSSMNMWNSNNAPITGGTSVYSLITPNGNGNINGVIKDNQRLISGDGAVGVYATGDDASNRHIMFHSGVIQVGDSTTNNTAIAIMSDGANHIGIGTGSNAENQTLGRDFMDVRIGQNAIGIYSNDFINTNIIEHNKTKMKSGATFAYLSGGRGNYSQFNNLKFDTSDARYTFGNNTLAYIGDNAEFHFDAASTGSKVDLDGGFSNLNNTQIDLYNSINSKIIVDAGTTMTSDTQGNNLVSVSSTTGRNATSGGTLLQKTTVGSNTTTPVAIGRNVTQAINNGTITLDTGTTGTGIYTLYGTASNNGTINQNIANSVAVYGDEGSLTQNDANGVININQGNSVGLYARDTDGLAAFDGNDKQNIEIVNKGVVNVNNGSAIGISTNNTSLDLTKATITNDTTGTKGINLNKTGAIGIYAPYTDIVKVGRIATDKTVTDVTVGIYADNKTKINTTTGEIDLNTSSQKQVAYYLKGDGTVANNPTINHSTSLGKILGHGVGILVDNIKINDTDFVTGMGNKLDYTVNGNSGDGIIGLYLKNDVLTTNDLTFTGDITVGSSVTDTTVAPNRTDYAVALYTDKQGNTTTPATIKNNLTVGERGVGLFAANDSNLIYDTGTITVNTNGKGGTGIYIAPTTKGNTSKVELKSNIVANGDNAAGVIVGQNSEFVFNKNAVMTFNGTGVGIYGNKDSIISDQGGLVLNPNGSAVERIRTHGGRIDLETGATMPLVQGQILYHSENGQVNNDAGATINDGGLSNSNQIGLYAEGHLDLTQLPSTVTTVPYPNNWNIANFDGVAYDGINQGDIDLVNSKSTVALYGNSANIINDTGATMKLGDESVALYGINDANKQVVTGPYTTKIVNASTVEIGKGSVGIFGDGEYIDATGTIKNAGSHGVETIINETSGIITTKGDTSVGIYRRGDSLDATGTTQVTTIENKGTIDLSTNNGTVGIFGTTETAATPSVITPVNGPGATRTTLGNYYNTISNTGTIKVGDTIDATSTTPEIRAVGIYAKNSKVTNTGGTIEVGKNGIAFAGDNSDITIDGNIVMPDGILAYGTNESTIDYQLGTDLTTSDEPIMYLMNGSVANVQGKNLNVTDNTTGVYVSGIGASGRSSSFDDFGTINLGKNSSGIYGTNSATISVRPSSTITSKNVNATGIILEDANTINEGTITLDGDSSLGIYSSNSGTVTSNIVNKGTINLNAEKSAGIYTNGNNQVVTNDTTGVINVSDATISSNANTGIFGNADTINNNGVINVGKNSAGIYSTSTNATSTINLSGTSKLNVADNAFGIYNVAGTINNNGITTVANNNSIGIYALDGSVVNQNSDITIGDNSFGIVVDGTSGNATTVTTASGTKGTLGKDSVYIYANTNNKGVINNGAVITATGDNNFGIYANGGETVNNTGNIDLSATKGNIGVYSVNGNVINSGTISIGSKGVDATGNTVYPIAIGSKNGYVENNGTLNVKGNMGIGIYANGPSSKTNFDVVNNGNIILDPSAELMAGGSVKQMVGIFLENGARGQNNGYIGTNGVDYTNNPNVKNVVGVNVTGHNSTFENHGTIEIDADNSSGIIIRGDSPTQLAVLKNYGTIKVSGNNSRGVGYNTYSTGFTGARVTNDAIAHTEFNNAIGNVLATGNAVSYQELDNTDKAIAGITLTKDPITGDLIILRNGVQVTADTLNPTRLVPSNIGFSNMGIYVDSLGRTKPIDMSGYAGGTTLSGNIDLLIGAEVADTTNAKNIIISDGSGSPADILSPFNNWVSTASGGTISADVYSGSLTWAASVNSTGTGLTQVSMAKIPYTYFVDKNHWNAPNVTNFADGLEQRYGVSGIGTREKTLFNKLNSIGNNEPQLLAQAYDEMMGHQYANIQQRTLETSGLIGKEVSHLRNDWHNPTKENNKLKLFGMKNSYNTDTAGIIDYNSNSYGVAYVHEDETMKLGEKSGWYLGAVNNHFKFKDIGSSTENQTLLKAGIFKQKAFDDNGSLTWEIDGSGYFGINEMDRNFLVVDEIFNAKSKYNTFGFDLKNTVKKDITTSEKTSVTPYASLNLGYGKYSNISEKSGEILLEGKGNDYYSIKPELGVLFNYKNETERKDTFNVSLGLAYENELGSVNDVNNKFKVKNTTADYFTLRGEKENRAGNGKVDLNLGWHNRKVGITANLGYDTLNKNVRGGLGIRAIY